MAETNCKTCTGVAFSKALICLKHDFAAPTSYNIPWWGQTRSEHIKNAGFVIGFKKSNGDAWRLDYDNEKKLHINWISGADGKNRVAHSLNSTKPQFDTHAMPGCVVPPEITNKDYATNPEAWMRMMWWSWTKFLLTAKKLPEEKDQKQIGAKYQDKPAYNSWEKISAAILTSKSYKDVAPFFA